MFDLELADLVQDRILRKRRSRGDNGSFTEDEYDSLVEREMQKTNKKRAAIDSELEAE